MAFGVYGVQEEKRQRDSCLEAILLVPPTGITSLLLLYTSVPCRTLILIRSPKECPTLCVVTTGRTLSLARYDRVPVTLVKGDSERFGTRGRRAFVLRFCAVPKVSTRGVQRIYATYALPLRSLMSSSQDSTSHHGSTTTHLSSRVGTTFSHSVTCLMRDQYTSFARANISF